jgi:hypothetical protein
MNIMNRRTLGTRLALTAFYFAATFSYLFYFFRGDTSCQDLNGFPIQIIRLAVACTAWTLFASFCGAIATQGLGRFFNISAISVTVIVALSGFASLPLWIYKGYGHFRFENTFDVSCFFREDAEIAFFIIIAPVLTALTLLCEYLAHRFTQQPTRPTS